MQTHRDSFQELEADFTEEAAADAATTGTLQLLFVRLVPLKAARVQKRELFAVDTTSSASMTLQT